MTKAEKQLAMVGGLVVGAGVLALIFWPKSAKAQTNAPQTVLDFDFGQKPDVRDVTLPSGGEIHVALPMQPGWVYDVRSHHRAVASGVVRGEVAVIRAGDRGEAAVDVVRTGEPDENGMRPVYGMRFNITVT